MCDYAHARSGDCQVAIARRCVRSILLASPQTSGTSVFSVSWRCLRCHFRRVATSAMLSSLDAKGLVQRKIDPSDARGFLLMSHLCAPIAPALLQLLD